MKRISSSKMMRSIPSHGFTLIELLVVIAIIGILSAIVLASLGNAKKSAYDAKVKAQLSSIRSAAEIYYDTNYNYGVATNSCVAGMFADVPSGLSKLSISANYPTGANTIVCNSSGTAYAVSDNLSTSGQYWCVDSSGASRGETAALGTATVCS